MEQLAVQPAHAPCFPLDPPGDAMQSIAGKLEPRKHFAASISNALIIFKNCQISTPIHEKIGVQSTFFALKRIFFSLSHKFSG